MAVPHWINFLERSDDKWAVEAEERERRGCNERKGVLRGRYKRKKDEYDRKRDEISG